MEENRQSPRHSKRLRAVIISDDNGSASKIHGKTLDISATGVSIISDYNLNTSGPVNVCLLMHPGDRGSPPVIVEAKSRVIYSILSRQQGGFRISLEFTKFVDDGAKVLKKFLAPSAPVAAEES